MSDKDAEAKGRFEPPPWEREAFEALAARRAEEQAAANMLAAAASAAGRPGDAALVATEEQPNPWSEEPAVKPTEVLSFQVSDGPTIADPVSVRLDDKAVQAMLSQLQTEERTDGAATKWVGWIASAITFVLGAGMLIFGLLAVRDSGGTFANVIGSGVLSVFGLCFMGMALWVWITTSRSRGR